MKSIDKMTQGELAAFVHTHLQANGIDVVLSGGAAVSIYSDNQYISFDIDFVPVFLLKRKDLIAVMNEIGFTEQGRYYEHPSTKYFIEFLAGPLSIGSEAISDVNEIQLSTGKLKLLSPTDCVKDRLSAYYHWGDRQCLEQAVLVTKKQTINLDEVERWSIKEDKHQEFIQYKKRVT
jgi:hypothetical protein